MTDRLMTRRETADLLGISPAMLWKLARSGRLEPTRIGRRVLYAPDVLRRFIDEQTTPGRAST